MNIIAKMANNSAQITIFDGYRMFSDENNSVISVDSHYDEYGDFEEISDFPEYYTSPCDCESDAHGYWVKVV